MFGFFSGDIIFVMKNKKIILLGISALVVFLFFTGPIPQDHEYHNFADKRQLFGILNCNDVLSNLFFFYLESAGCLKFVKIRLFRILNSIILSFVPVLF